jgi:Poxvirus A32 protein
MSLGFQHPFTCTIAGPTKSGKTVFVQNLLQACELYIDPRPSRVVWVYGVVNEAQMKNIQNCTPQYNIEFTAQIPELDEFSPDDPTLLIIDDLMHDAGKSKVVSDLFTKGCHHRNISVILILQNLFHQGRLMRDIHTSTNYLVLFNNPRDKSQIRHLERQCFPESKNFLVDAYSKACSKPHGYLIIDFTQSTPQHYRVCTGIFPPDIVRVFVPSKYSSG